MTCEKCGKERARFIKGRDICQKCYREEKRVYFLMGKKIEPKNESHKKIVEKRESGKSCREIAQEMGMNEVYVRRIVHEYMERVDQNGNSQLPRNI